MFRKNVAGDTEDEYFENRLWTVNLPTKWEIGAGRLEGELTSKTVTVRDQYGVPILRRWWWKRGEGTWPRLLAFAHSNPDPTRARVPLLHSLSRAAHSRLSPKNGHQGGSGHPPSPRPIRLSSVLRTKIHNYHGPAREEPCVSMIPDTAFGYRTAFNPNSLKDDDLAGRLGLQLKELTKLVTVLDKAGLVKT